MYVCLLSFPSVFAIEHVCSFKLSLGILKTYTIKTAFTHIPDLVFIPAMLQEFVVVCLHFDIMSKAGVIYASF